LGKDERPLKKKSQKCPFLAFIISKFKILNRDFIILNLKFHGDRADYENK